MKLYITIVAAFAVLLTAVLLVPTPPASASNDAQCSNGEYRRWPNQTATYDRSHGDFDDWWQDEIDAAADIWNDDSGANFSFHDYTGSGHEWYKETRSWDDRPGLTDTLIINAELCQLTDTGSLFNTRFTFSECGDDCDQDEGELVRRHVAAHEFSHWFVLDDTEWPWQYTCVSFPKYRTDYSLCNHEKDHVQDIYGED